MAQYTLTRSRVMGVLAALVTIVVGGPVVAHGQAAIDMRVDMQARHGAGRLFDANPALYGSRFNNRRASSPLLLGNLYASGLAGRGSALRIQSPIPAATSFRGTLGSSALSGFRRDSIASGDLYSAQSPQSFHRPYYEMSNTVPTVSFLKGHHASGVATLGPQDLREDLRLDSRRLLNIGAPSVGIRPLPEIAGTSSSIFGLQSPPRVPLPEDPQDGEWRTWRRLHFGEDPRTDEQTLRESLAVLEQQGRTLATPLEAALRQQPRVGLLSPPDRLPDWARADPTAEGEDDRSGLLIPEVGRAKSEIMPVMPRTHVSDPAMLPQYDRFNDLRLALAYEEEPDAEWFGKMLDAVDVDPDLLQQMTAMTEEPPQDYLTRLLDTPLRSFVGAGPTSLNDELLKAESLMEIGHYTEAAERFETAHLLDPLNPLPLVGRGHALLAAGEYRSAAYWLLKGLERFPELTQFGFDLTELMGGGEIVDIRRADIMDRLAQSDRVELRFLLGYLEYHSGDKVRGMRTLREAARHPRASAFIAAYPDLIEGKGVLPPPKVELPTSSAPEDGDELLPGEDPLELPDETLKVPPVRAPTERSPGADRD